MNLIDQQNSLIINVTYNCNAKCNYCKCGSNKKTENNIQSDEYIYLSIDKLNYLKTERVVLLGGEPLLRYDLEKIINYYKQLNITSIIIITNGLSLTKKRLESLINAGLTGIVFSIDSFEHSIIFKTRAYNQNQFELIKSNFSQALSFKEKYKLEIGITVVVSTANIKDNALENLITFTNNLSLDWIKFQPIFDDGFVGSNSKHLLLSSIHSDLIRATGKNIISISKTETNSLVFWNSLADLLEGKKLIGKTCGLDTKHLILENGIIKICSWINYPQYDITKRNLTEIQSEFTKIKNNCNTNTFCYCLQNLSHKWSTELK